MPPKIKLTPALIEAAEKLIRAGNYDCTVFGYLNIPESTWYYWIKKGREMSSGPYYDFAVMVDKARAVAEIGAVSGILQSGKDGQWQALAWFLERKFNERWGKRESIRQELSGKDGTPLPDVIINFVKSTMNTTNELTD